MKFSEAFEKWQKEGGYLILGGNAVMKNIRLTDESEEFYSRYIARDISKKKWYLQYHQSGNSMRYSIEQMKSDQWQVQPTLEEKEIR